MVVEFTEQYVPNGNRTLIIYIDYGYRLFVHFFAFENDYFCEKCTNFKN